MTRREGEGSLDLSRSRGPIALSDQCADEREAKRYIRRVPLHGAREEQRRIVVEAPRDESLAPRDKVRRCRFGDHTHKGLIGHGPRALKGGQPFVAIAMDLIGS